MFPIGQYHAPPSWIEGCTKTRLGGHPGRHACLANMAEGGFSAAWSKSLRNVPFFDASFIETWLETDGEVPKKVVTRGYSNFCEGYIFDVEVKTQDTEVIVRARSYKSQRKNEEPWRLQGSLFIILKFCLSSNFA